MLDLIKFTDLVNNGEWGVKLSTRARYGTRALLDLARHQGKQPVQLKDIASRQDISLHYLEHIITPLVSAGIVRSTRGTHGGLQLASHPGEIKLSEVVPLLEGAIIPVDCLSNPESCPHHDLCAARDVWAEMKKAMDGVLESKTLQDLIDRQKEKEQPKKGMYYI